MNTLLSERDLFRVPVDLAIVPVIPTSKGTEILEGMLLSQYNNSPNLKEYYMAFIAELDLLFEQVSEVYYGRFLEVAVGEQLDVIGIILQQTRSVILPTAWFGFQGALLAEGMADEVTPALGGIFKDENEGEGEVTILSDFMYRRMLTAKAAVLNRDSIDISLAYFVISTLLGRVPSTFEIRSSDGNIDEWVLSYTLDPTNGGLVTIIEAGRVWDISSPSGGNTNSSSGGRVFDLVDLIEGEEYTIFIDSDKPVNLSMFDGNYSMIISGINVNSLTFVAEAINRFYVCPSDLTTVRVSNPKIYNTSTSLSEREVSLRVAAGTITDQEISFVLYMRKYFVPTGTTFTITQV